MTKCQIKVKEIREGTTPRRWQHWAHKSQDEDKQSKTTQHRQLNRRATRTFQHQGGNQVVVKNKEFLLLIRHPPCDSYTDTNGRCVWIT